MNHLSAPDHHVVLRPATADLYDIRDWISQDDPKRAVSYLQELEGSFGRLAARSAIGRPRDDIGPGVRSTVHRNHVVSYRIGGTGIEISRVVHDRRDLGRVLVWFLAREAVPKPKLEMVLLRFGRIAPLLS